MNIPIGPRPQGPAAGTGAQAPGACRPCRLERLSRRYGGEGGCGSFSIVASGDAAWQTLLGLIAASEASLDLQYYIWDKDESGRRLLSALLDAADRGVRIRLLLDDVGAPRDDALLAGLDAHRNVAVRLFNPLPRGLQWSFRVLSKISRLGNRMHNKTLIADGAAAVVGSRNVGDRYFGRDRRWNFDDLDLVAVGPVVGQAARAFEAFWQSPWCFAFRSIRAGPELRDPVRRDVDRAWGAESRRRAGRRAYRALIRECYTNLVAADAAVVVFDPPSKIGSREPHLMRQVAARTEGLPRDELLLESPFFIPGDRGLAYLGELVRSGVRVRVVTNSAASAELPVPFAAYRWCRRQLLEVGIQLHEFRSRPAGVPGGPGRNLHGKVAVADRRHVLLGAMNADPRSMLLNTEIALLIRSEALAERVAQHIEGDASARHSYRLALDNRRTVWRDEVAGRLLRREPDVPTWWPLAIRLLSLLPFRHLL